MTLAQQPAPPTPHVHRLTRDDIVRLGQADRPWDFLPIAEAALRLAPEDPGLLLLAAANFAKVGLRTPAREKLAALPAALHADPAVRQLEATVDRLPDDRIRPDHRIATCRANLAALTSRLGPRAAAELAAALPAWEARTRDEEWFSAADTNIARRAGGAWARLANLAEHARAARIPDGADPITIDGAQSPWLLLRVLRDTPRRSDGLWRCIRLVEPDPAVLFDSLASLDLRDRLCEPRLHCFVGAGAAADLAADLEARHIAQITGPVLSLPTDRGTATAAPILARASARQAERQQQLLASVGAIYGPRNAAWWARRYSEALGAGGERDPLRVLIITHRFSTFIRHSSADLAAALRGAGCRVELLMEPDDSHLLTTVGHLESLDRFQPDLLIAINYTRHNLPRVIPANIPFACWVQDAMAHLFREDAGRAQSELDFLVGHTHPELFTLFGYPRERALPTPVVVSDRKFHPGPVAPDLAERLTCEIAFASNQSETPEACRDRLIAESSASATSVRAISALYERIKDLGADTMSMRLSVRLDGAIREELARLGVADDPRLATHALNQWARPMADRLLRHETARWAAELAEEHNWRFYLFGRGWEAHPTLHRHARGPLEHGEELRASYRCAAVHLHASINWLLHQRVMECALSGGLPLCRLKREDLSPIEAYVIRALIARGSPAACWIPTRALLYPAADSPEALAAVALFQRLGLAAPHLWSVLPAWLDDPTTYDRAVPMDHDTAWLLGDLAETTFTDKRSLAAAVARATDRPAWRANTAGAIATRTKRRLTYTATATDLLALIRASLARASG